jgi:WD40 repeat protein
MANTAFMSYSHAADGKLAPRLQAGLQRFAKPWHQTRAVRVFRDKTSLSVNPALWSSICKSIDASEFFILFASPEAAESSWVQQEVDYWLSKYSSEKLLIVLTDGELHWSGDKGDFDWDRSNALPQNLAGVFVEEPLYLDLRWAKREEDLSLNNPRFREAVSELSATLRGQSKDELIGADVRFHKRAMRLAWSAASALFILLIIASAAAFYANQQKDEAENQRQTAIQQRDRANEQRRIAHARQLAAQAQLKYSQGTELLQQSTLLAIESYKRVPSIEASQVMSQAVGILPKLTARLKHNDRVNSVSFNPQGDRIATGCSDGTVGIWELEDRTLVTKLPHEGSVRNVAFSKDGSCLAALGADGNGYIWQKRTDQSSANPDKRWRLAAKIDHGEYSNEVFFIGGHKYLAVRSGLVEDIVQIFKVSNGQLVMEPTHEGGIMDMAQNPRGTQLATAGKDSRVSIWNPGSRKRLASLVHDGPVMAVHYRPSGRNLVSVTSKGTIYSWNTKNWKRTSRVKLNTDLDKAAFSADGQTLATAHQRTVQVWNTESGSPLHRFEDKGHAFGALLLFSPDSQYLVTTVDYGNPARLWNLNTGREVARLNYGLITEIVFSPDGSKLASVGLDNSARVWHYQTNMANFVNLYKSSVKRLLVSHNQHYLAIATEDGQLDLIDLEKNQNRYLTHSAGVVNMVFSHDEKYLTTLSDDGTGYLWETETGTEIERISPANLRAVTAVDLSPEGHQMAFACKDGLAFVWDIDQKQILAKIHYGSEKAGLAYSPDGEFLAVYGDDGKATVWTTGNWEEKIQLEHIGTGPEAIFSPKGSYFATVAQDGSTSLWKTNTWLKIARFDYVLFHPHIVAFSPDEKYIAIAERGGGFQVWRIANRKLVARIEYAQVINNLKFCPDSRYLITAAQDKTAIIWEPSTGRKVLSLVHDNDVTDVDFTPNGNYLLTGSQDHTASLWYWRPQDLLNEGCDRLTRNLSPQEWQEYFNGEPYRRTCPDIAVNFDEWLDYANKTAMLGKQSEAAAAYKRIVDWALETSDGEISNLICWYGCLEGFAKIVLPACNHAVDLASADLRANYQDSRGLAQALIGNRSQAISDFEAFIKANTGNGQFADLVPKRKKWLSELRNGRNPFDAKVLESLKKE